MEVYIDADVSFQLVGLDGDCRKFYSRIAKMICSKRDASHYNTAALIKMNTKSH